MIDGETPGIKEALERLDGWLESNGWTGYDPYDILGKPPLLWLCKNRLLETVSRRLVSRFPELMIGALGVEKSTNSKAMGLFVRAYTLAYTKTRGHKFLQKAKECATWLLEHPSPNKFLSWGYPFDWQSRVLIPKDTPNVVVTSVVANSILDLYELEKDKKYLAGSKKAAEFVLKGLNRHVDSEGDVCFSYTPLDNFHVHNANLMGASFLARLSSINGDEGLLSIAKRAANYTMKHQNEDGSFFYWGPPSRILGSIDNYHTGFVLEHLYDYMRFSSDWSYRGQLEKGLRFYKENLFFDNGAPKRKIRRPYPIDIHGAAQGIITFSKLRGIGSGNLDLSKNIAEWTINNMQDPSGHFYYRIYKNRKDKTPYIRWGQAWMMWALANLLEIEKNGGKT